MKVEIAEDQNITKELDVFALGLVKKYERLLVLSKKDLNDGSNSIKNLKTASQIANNISSNLNIQILKNQLLKKKQVFCQLRKRSEVGVKIKWKKLKGSTT